MSNFGVNGDKPNEYLMNLLKAIGEKYGNKDGVYLNTDEEVSIFNEKAKTLIDAGVCTKKDVLEILGFSKNEAFDNDIRGFFIKEFDEKGNVVKTTSDDNCDNKADRVSTYEYNEKGNMVKKMNDTDCDGTVDYVVNWEYDEKGNEVKCTIDKDADGKVDYVETNEYDEKGNKVKFTIDEDGDGKVDNVQTREYDEKGYIVKITTTNADGKVEVNDYKSRE